MKLSLSHKLLGGAFGSALLAFAIGLVGIQGVNKVSHSVEQLGTVEAPRLHALQVAEATIHVLIRHIRTLLYPGLSLEERAALKQAFLECRAVYGAALADFESHPLSPEEEIVYAEFQARIGDWVAVNNRFFAFHEEMLATGIVDPGEMLRCLEAFSHDFAAALVRAEEAIATGQPLAPLGGEETCRFGLWLDDAEANFPTLISSIREARPHRVQFRQAYGATVAALNDGDLARARAVGLPAMRESFGAMRTQFAQMQAVADRAAAEQAKMVNELLGEGTVAFEAGNKAMETLVATVEETGQRAVQRALAESHAARLRTIVIVALGSLVALGSGVILSRYVVQGIRGVVKAMSAGAQHVAAASLQVAGSSQTLSDGASEQAASLEQISASLNEMNSMTQRNSASAEQCNERTDKMTESVNAGTAAVSQLDASIARIKASAEETAKIVKTIDEIAFQTNILALNAAVEAARAGDAGAGFAVVADEVRNLAQRSADSAKDTAILIQQAQENVNEGVQVTAQVSNVLREIAAASSQLNGLVAEVATSSKDNAEGINQVAGGISQMDQVTQTNAAGSEEMASAAQQLSAQSQELEGAIGRLIEIVDGQPRSTATGSAVDAVLSAATEPVGSPLRHPKQGLAGHRALTEATAAPTLTFN